MTGQVAEMSLADAVWPVHIAPMRRERSAPVGAPRLPHLPAPSTT